MFGAVIVLVLQKSANSFLNGYRFLSLRFISLLICFLQLFDFDFVRVMGVFESLTNFLGVVGAASLRREWRALHLAILIDEVCLAFLGVFNSRVVDTYQFLQSQSRESGLDLCEHFSECLEKTV
jgi:hypothetical protein